MKNIINVKKFGFAVGITLALLYLGCAIVMATVGHDGTVSSSNSLLHGLDVSTIVRMNVSLTVLPLECKKMVGQLVRKIPVV